MLLHLVFGKVNADIEFECAEYVCDAQSVLYCMRGSVNNGYDENHHK